MFENEFGGEGFYRNFMSDIYRTINRGDTAYCFFEYQVKNVKEKYKSKVEVRYDEYNDWWTCKLKK